MKPWKPWTAKTILECYSAWKNAILPERITAGPKKLVTFILLLTLKWLSKEVMKWQSSNFHSQYAGYQGRDDLVPNHF